MTTDSSTPAAAASSNETPKVICYNKGCGQLFDLNNNSNDACQCHPGVPVFHDALKGWSCCNKKSTDFTQFLNIPGCTRTQHSNVPPPEPEKPVRDEVAAREEVVVKLEERKKPEAAPRPTQDEPLVELRRTVAPNLVAALEKLTLTTQNVAKVETGEKSDAIEVDTPCKNASCNARYQNESSNSQKCVYHPGVAIFHEGMKFWSCCQRKTSDFDNFLNQIGCEEGKHVWQKKETTDGVEPVNCRYDHHQTGGFVIVTVYSKNPVPEKTTILTNKIKLDMSIIFEAGTKSFNKKLELFGVIDVEQSVVNFFQTKVEIKLKKADTITWSKLEHTPQ